jgi:hypothetical protein
MQETSIKEVASRALLPVYLAYPSNLKMEMTCSFETSVDFQRMTQRYMPEDKTLLNTHCFKEFGIPLPPLLTKMPKDHYLTNSMELGP